MYLELIDIVVLLLVGALVIQFLRTQQHTQLAHHAAKRYCQKQQVQFLDQSVFLQKQRIRFFKPFGFVWCKNYGFEFSVTGERRYKGLVRMRGAKISNIELEPHVIPIDESQAGEQAKTVH